MKPCWALALQLLLKNLVAVVVVKEENQNLVLKFDNFVLKYLVAVVSVMEMSQYLVYSTANEVLSMEVSPCLVVVVFAMEESQPLLLLLVVDYSVDKVMG